MAAAKKSRRAAHACRYKTTFRPDEAYVSDVAYKFVENRDHVRMPEFIGERDLGKQANSNTGQNSQPGSFRHCWTKDFRERTR